MSFRAPVRDLAFALKTIEHPELLRRAFPDLDDDTVQAVLEAAGAFADNELAPLNRKGDLEGARYENGVVTAAPGFADAYRHFVEQGWNSLSADPQYGGQGLSKAMELAVFEMVHAANMAFGLCPMLTQGAIEALTLHGTPRQKELVLPKLVSGEWTGAMCLTEPQAGSDLAALTSIARPDGKGGYLLSGQKIFITWGDHDAADNICHLIIARTPDAPPGVKGISLFLANKFQVKDDGSLGPRNSFRPASIEHKLGIHGSPTCVMIYEDAEAELVGELGQGLAHMFVMMNAARFSVGLEGVGLCERAYQRARDYARDRKQGVEVGVSSREKVAIIRHPDVRRMLLQMKTRTEALRAVACVVAAAMDTAATHPDHEVRRESQAFADLMIPVVKGWCTETSVFVTSLGIQVHGGMGYAEETGAAQHWRDSRITPIYEGTTGIQAIDLMGRKIARDGGVAAQRVLRDMDAVQRQLEATGDRELLAVAARLADGIGALRRSVEFVIERYGSDPKTAVASSVPLLELFGSVAGGWQMARAALAACELLSRDTGDADFLRAKVLSARFYADHVLTQAEGLAETVVDGADAVLAYSDKQF